jgi:hypothetical protein
MQVYMHTTHKLCVGLKAALDLRHMPGLMPPWPSRANTRASGVMSAIRSRHPLRKRCNWYNALIIAAAESQKESKKSSVRLDTLL